jgi:hypothetical protein
LDDIEYVVTAILVAAEVGVPALAGESEDA